MTNTRLILCNTKSSLNALFQKELLDTVNQNLCMNSDLQSAEKRLAHFDCLRLKINVDPAHAFCGRAKGANIDWWGGGRIKLTVDVLSVISKFIDEFQPLIFETVNNIVKVQSVPTLFFAADCSFQAPSFNCIDSFTTHSIWKLSEIQFCECKT